MLETTQHADTPAQKPSGSYTKHNESTGKSSLLCGCCGRRGHAEQNCFYAPGGKFADRPNPKDRPQKTYPKQTGKVASMEQLHDEVAGLKQKLAAFTSGAPAPPQQQYTRQWQSNRQPAKGQDGVVPGGCFVCGETGHRAAQCPKRHKAGGPVPKQQTDDRPQRKDREDRQGSYSDAARGMAGLRDDAAGGAKDKDPQG